MTDRELLQMALDALKHLCLHSAAIKGYDGEQVQTAIDALKARLAQPEKAECDGGQCGIGGYCKQCPKTQHELEPVAWADKFDIDRDGHDFWVSRQKPAKDEVPLYTAPPQREWQGLTDEDKNQIAKEAYNKVELTAWELAQRVGEFTEAKLKDKNYD